MLWSLSCQRDIYNISVGSRKFFLSPFYSLSPSFSRCGVFFYSLAVVYAVSMCVNFSVRFFGNSMMICQAIHGQSVVCWSWNTKTIREHFNVEQPIIILDWWSQIPANDCVVSALFLLSSAFSSFICSMAVLVYNNSNTIKPFLGPFSAKTYSPTRVTSNQLLSDVKTFGSHNHYGLWIFFWQWENTLIKYFGCFGEWVTLMMSERKEKTKKHGNILNVREEMIFLALTHRRRYSTELPFFKRWVNHTHSIFGIWCVCVFSPLEISQIITIIW